MRLRRYQVLIQPYSLEPGKVGEHVGTEILVSHHSTLAAADRSLTRAFGKDRAHWNAAIWARNTNAARWFIYDRETGMNYSRDGARQAHQQGF